MSLILVPTPLGNLRDITLRALDALRTCDLIAAEDTRVTRRLLSAHEISGKAIIRCDRHSGPALLEHLAERAISQNVVLMTDAGTPGISDPGRELIVEARSRGASIEVLPGGTALICAAVLSGFPLPPLLFDGFFPRTAGGREEAVRKAMRTGAVTVWYESAQRLRASLETLTRQAPSSHVFVARELTKKFEQHLMGTPSEVLAALPDPLKGEITLVVRWASSDIPMVITNDAASLDERIDELLAAGQSVATIAKELSRSGLGDRKELYARAGDRKRRSGS